MDYPGRLIAGMIAVILISLFPLQYIAQSNSESIDTLVDERTQALSDAIREKGYLDVAMYEDYINFLDTTGELYDVAIEDIHPVTGEEISVSGIEGRFNLLAAQTDQPFICTDSSHNHGISNTIYSHIKEGKNVISLSFDSGMKTNKPEVIIGREKEISSFAAHMHTSDCYIGHNHTASGCVQVLCSCGSTTAIYKKTDTYNLDQAGWYCSNCGKGVLTSYATYNSSGDANWRYEIRMGQPNGTGSMVIMSYTDLYTETYPPRKNIEAYNTHIQFMNYTGPTTKNLTQLMQDYSNLYQLSGISTTGYYRTKNTSNSVYQANYTFTNDKNVNVNISDYGNIHSGYGKRTESEQWIFTIYLNNDTTRRTYEYREQLSNGSYISGQAWVKTLVESILSKKDTYNKYGIISAKYVVDAMVPYVPDYAAFMGTTWSTLPMTCGITNEDTTPICNQVVTSITATNPNQTVDKGGAIITTATATYLDGHTGVVNCTSNFNPNLVGTQLVTLTYSGKVDNAKTTGTKNCGITVVVKSAHVHTNDCYAGHRHTTECLSMPIAFSITHSGSGLYDPSYNSIYIRCGYCHKNILTIQRTDIYGGEDYIQIYDYINNIQKTLYQLRNSTEYNTLYNQYNQLANNLNPYIKSTQTDSGGSYFYTNMTGYVLGKDFNFELPYIGRITKCNSCNGTPYIFRLVGGWNDYYGNFSYSYRCNYCGEEIMKLEDSSWMEKPYTLGIYRNGRVIYTNNDTNTLRSLFNNIGQHDSEGRIDRLVSINESWLQLPVVKDAFNHGCTYPNPACQLTEDTVPICDRVVTSITATNPNQTVDKGGAIITTATATYLDGHTAIVNCTSNFNPNTVGTQTVTLTYSGLVGNAKTTGIRTCTVSVTVKENSTPSHLIITPSSYTVYNGSEPTYTVTLVYTSGLTKVIQAGYIKAGWTLGPGNKFVTFSYTEAGKTVIGNVTITVLPNITYISALPLSQDIERYSPVPVFIVTGHYEDGSSKNIDSYIVFGYSKTLIGTQDITISYTENGISRSTSVTVNVIPLQKTCPQCGTRYPLDHNDVDNGCPVCNQAIVRIEVEPAYITVEEGFPLGISVEAVFKDRHREAVSGWTSNYDPGSTGLQLVTVEYGGFAAEITVWVEERRITCPVCGTRYPASLTGCPICSENVVSISTAPGTVIINQNELISLEVTAHYADGSSGIVNDWSIDRTSAEAGTFTATVSYRSVSTTIILIVIPHTAVQCPICGLIYEPSENPRGCPACSAEITGIEAYLTSGSNRVQVGAVPGISVVLIFRDLHREIAMEGYTLIDFNPVQLGIQTITIIYNEFSTTIEVEVVDAIASITCPNGHVYYRNEDGSDPGCPYCTISEGLGTVYYFDITYIYEILDLVYSDGKYRFLEGNYITITVTKRNKSIFYNIQNTFFRTSMLGMKKRFQHGGGVY